MKIKCYCIICKEFIGEYYPSLIRKTCSKKCKGSLTSKNNKGKANPNYKSGKYIQNRCKKCKKIISPVSTYCYKCRALYNNSFKGKKHTKKSKMIIGKKSKEKYTTKYLEKIRKKVKGKKSIVNGYIYIKDYEHPNRNDVNQILEHRKVMSNYLNRPLKKEEIVHHINCDKTDNRIKNLYLYSSFTQHLNAHHLLMKLIKNYKQPIKTLITIGILKFKKGKYEIKEVRK